MQVEKIDDTCAQECCAPPPLILPPRTDRLPFIREAFRLEWLTIGWMTVEAVVAIGAGVTAGSLVLVAFGLDSVIELASAGVLMWRLSVELRHGQKFSEHAERIASRIGGALLFALAAYVTAAAVWQLWNSTGDEFSWPGFLVALIDSRHALLGATQDRNCREARKPCAPCRRYGSCDMRMAVIRGCRQSRGAMACGCVVD
jgi:hypothetical protein